jgi:hypothetical protein
VLFQGTADVEPCVSAFRLDEGVSEAAAWLHIHGGHVDLDEVVSIVDIIASRWERRMGDERGGCTPSTVG